MKKTFKKIISYICLITLIFSLSGCSQFVDLVGNGNGYYEQMVVTMPIQKQMIFCDTGETLSQSEPVSVTFGVNTSATYESSAKAASKVCRSVVAINVSNAEYQAGGSGVIVDIRGGLEENEYYVMTCHHVISGGGLITISIPDSNFKNTGDIGYDENYVFAGYIGAGKNTDGEQAISLVGGDRDGDIALLKLKVGDRVDKYHKPIKIEKATFPNPEDPLYYGEEVFAIGNPMGRLPMTYMHGYISYIDRTATFESVGIMTNLIQHDCAITHGNSGGGLFNMKGQLVGITNGGFSNQVGLSYAIPYYDSTEYGFMRIAERLIKNNNAKNYGYVEGRWELGVVVTDAESSVKGSTLMIKSLVPNSNASGILQEGDYITGMEFLGDKYTITSVSSFASTIFVAREYLKTTSQTSEIKFTIQRAQ